uniref:Uncharacterized protein n=1 Tax=Salix viminalis TaxID=40686 RepID=A0A6N2KXJ3_SALVM
MNRMCSKFSVGVPYMFPHRINLIFAIDGDAVFAYIYHQSFVVHQSVSVDMLMEQILRSLPYEEQYTLYMRLGEMIQGKLT